jgi:hypothetical protein
MAAPPGVNAARWSTAVSRVAADNGWSSAQADTWLNTFWSGLPFNEAAGNVLASGRLRVWLAAQKVGVTVPHATRKYLT